MLPLLLVAQLLAPAVPRDPTYGSPALRALVARAAEGNRAPPPVLASYRAQVESEIAVLLRRADDQETAVSLEQAQNDVRWERSGGYEQQVTGYRARQAGPSLSALAVIRTAWTIPLLYGNRLSDFLGDDGSRGFREDGDAGPSAPNTPRGVHPFAPGRERTYRYRGGDTIAVLQTQQRSIAIVRVEVEPRVHELDAPTVVFRGEIDLDAERGEIIRMRGQFLTIGRRGPDQRLLVLPMHVLAYVDLESVEVDGRYWLPLRQRIEKHVNVGGVAEGRSVFRIVSRFRHHVAATEVAADLPDESSHPRAQVPAAIPEVHRLTVVSTGDDESVRAWWLPLGQATEALRADDFADVEGTAPVSEDLTWSFQAQRLADIVHFNRIEGWSTGAAVMVVPGARAPDVTIRGNASWAWTQQTVRGRIEGMRSPAGARWAVGMRLGRTLDITNDFTAPHDSGGALFAALAGRDDYDYVDRTAATAWLDLDIVPRAAMLRLEAGLAADRAAQARLTRGLLRGDEPLGPNRGVDRGDYARAAVLAEWNPVVHASPMASGLGVQLRHEVAVGQLAWQRATVRVTARRESGAFGAAVRVDGGLLMSAQPPSQQLFELGGGPSFPGFTYKEFAGDRALVTHWRALYRLPVLRAPLRIGGCTCLSAPAPALAVTLHAATLSASSSATLASIARLGSMGDVVGRARARPGEGTPLSTPTDGWRGSVEAGLQFFGGAFTVGAARVLEPHRPWRLTFALGQAW